MLRISQIKAGASDREKNSCRQAGKIGMCEALTTLIAEGRQEGMESEKRNIVKNMLKRGMSVEEIMVLAECGRDFIEEVGKIDV